MTVIPFTRVFRRLAPGAVLPGEDVERFREPLGRLVGARAADRVLTRTGIVGVTRMPAEELASAAQIAERLAARIVAAQDLGLVAADPHRTVLASSVDVVRALPAGFTTLETEVLLAFALSANLAVKGTVYIGKGGDVGVNVQLRGVFVPLVRLAAAAFILAHNHPSSTPNPSPEDIHLTHRVAEAGRVLGIQLLDHVIVTPTSAVSLRNLGVIGDVGVAV